MKTKSLLLVLLAAGLALVAGCATKPARLGVGAGGYYSRAAFAPAGHSLAALGFWQEGSVVFDLDTRVECSRFHPDKKLKAGNVFDLAYTPEGRLLVASLGKNEVSIWDTVKSNRLTRFSFPQGLLACCLSPDGRWLATILRDQPTTIWEVASGRKGVELTNSLSVSTLLGFSFDGKWLATDSPEHRIQIWDISTGALDGELPPQKEPPQFIAFAPDAGQLAVSAGDVSVFNRSTREVAQTIKAPAMSAGTKVAGGFWALASMIGGGGIPPGASEVISRAPSGPVVFAPTGRHLAVVNSTADLNTALAVQRGKQQVRVFDLSNMQLVSTVAFNTAINSIAFSPDGSLIATAGQGVEVWDWQKAPAKPSRPAAFAAIRVRIQTNFTANPAAPLAGLAVRSVVVGAFTDERPDETLGERTAAFKARMSDILPARPVAESVRDAVAGIFPKLPSGANGGSPKLKVTGRVKKFTVATPANLVAWKIEATVELELSVTNAQDTVVHTASYVGQARHTTAMWPGQTIIERTCNEALQQLVRHVEADPVWPTL